MFSPELIEVAAAVITAASDKKLKIATAESCTGGLLSALLTEIPHSSNVFEYGYVTYANAAKEDMLDVSPEMLALHGAVSEPVAAAMAAGALARSRADVAVSITGIAGPGGGSAKKPVGLVYMAGMRADGKTIIEKHEFGDLGRSEIRRRAVAAALAILRRLL
ncbi:MAG: CinA family protein [Sphingomonadales bacterium]|nr:CinA family protein [Sphingomonadales bacterium]